MGIAASKNEAFWDSCGYGHTAIVKRFIDQGVDVNWKSFTHDSCAIHVASQGKHEIVKLLINAHCNVNALDDRGNLPLHHAAMRGHTDIMETLLEAGSEINTPDKNDWSPLITASYFCQPASVEILISHNCDVHQVNKDDRTALHEACRTQSTDEESVSDIVQQLVNAGCDIERRSKDQGRFYLQADFTPLMFAAYHNHTLAAESLLQAGCDKNAQEANDWTALHWAADRNYKDMVKVLLTYGADPLITASRGELALDRATNNEVKETLQNAVEIAKLRQEEMGSSGLDTPESGCTPSPSPTPSPRTTQSYTPLAAQAMANAARLFDNSPNKNDDKVMMDSDADNIDPTDLMISLETPEFEGGFNGKEAPTVSMDDLDLSHDSENAGKEDNGCQGDQDRVEDTSTEVLKEVEKERDQCKSEVCSQERVEVTSTDVVEEEKEIGEHKSEVCSPGDQDSVDDTSTEVLEGRGKEIDPQKSDACSDSHDCSNHDQNEVAVADSNSEKAATVDTHDVNYQGDSKDEAYIVSATDDHLVIED